ARRDCWAPTPRRPSPTATWSSAPAGARCASSACPPRRSRGPSARRCPEAVMHFWGVKANTVWLWREALGGGRMTEGTTALMSERLSPVLERARVAAAPTWSSPERGRKLSAALKGRPQPRHVVEAKRKGRTGKPHDEAARAKMSQAQRSRVRADDWTAEADEAVRTMTPAQAVLATERTLAASWGAFANSSFTFPEPAGHGRPAW